MTRNKYLVRFRNDGHNTGTKIEADAVNVMPGLVVFVQVPQVETPNVQPEARIVYAATTDELLDITEVAE